MPITQKITPFLWFDSNAEEAVNFYVSTFANSRITSVMRNGEAGPGPAGSVLVMGFELEGQAFSALNGGPTFKLSEAMSLHVDCESQEEIDRLWDVLGAGGQHQPCGWLKDRFGLSWQINTPVLRELMIGTDPEKSARVMAAMMQMKKVDIAALRKAYAGD
jgi:predicted 3-demethylubiquinone-9 3-methyltransferase (glyoxalase superfamily)